MKRVSTWVMAALATTAIVAAAPKFTSVWKNPAAYDANFFGKKVAALVMTDDEGLRMSGEEALTRELSSRGLQGVPTYRIVPREELKNPEKAKGWFERSGVEGVVVLKPVSAEKKTNYNTGIWLTPYYSTLWGYYGGGWSSVYVIGPATQDRVVTVETMIFSVPANALLWAGVTETTNPKELPKFVKELAEASVKELHEVGLAKQIKK